VPPNLRLSTPGEACRTAIAAAERGARIPQALLAAIARVESGRYDPATNRTTPWPWTINAEGKPGVFDTKEQAIAAVRMLQAQGVRSIDVGCMQVNLMHHPNAFASLEQAFDPVANAGYAARFLTQLREQTGTWEAATARYHSATPEYGGAYQRKVAAVLPEEQRFASATQLIGISPQAGRIIAPELARSGMPVGGFIPPTRSNAGRIIPLALASNGAIQPGRPLDAYRSQPIPVAGRPPG
jgi:hypothetical protein